MKMTMPQIIMLNHAASVNAKKSGLDRLSSDKPDDNDVVTVGGKHKRLSEMDSKDYAEYYSDWRRPC